MARKSGPVVREAAAASVPDAAGPTFSKEVSAGEFKARCLALMDEVRDSGGEYVITKRGEPVAKLVPVRMERRPLLGSMKGTARIASTSETTAPSMDVRCIGRSRCRATGLR